MLNKHTKTKSLSANKLAEYLQAKPSRRETIVKQRIKEDKHGANYYALAQGAICRLLIHGRVDETLYQSELHNIEEHPGWGMYPEKLIENNVLALKGFIKMHPRLIELVGQARPPSVKLEPIDFNGLIVSNAMDVEIVVTDKKVKYGAIKLYLNQKYSLEEFSGDVVSSLLFKQLEEAKGARNLSKSHVCVVDIFASQIFSTPSTYKRLFNEAGATSREVIARWATLAN